MHKATFYYSSGRVQIDGLPTDEAQKIARSMASPEPVAITVTSLNATTVVNTRLIIGVAIEPALPAEDRGQA